MSDKVSAIVTAGVDTAPLGKDALYKVDYATGTPASSASYIADVVSLAALQGFIVNGIISPTVTSSNLTVAIKALDGTDPSATNPVIVRIGNDYRRITGALSVTLNAGTQWFALGTPFAAIEQDFFVYLGWRAASSAVVVGFSRIPNAALYSDFSATSTNEKYGVFSTAPASSDVVVCVGRFAATLSASASYNWSVPTYTTKNLKQRPTEESRLLTYTPTFTNLTVGNGTLTTKYMMDQAYFYIELDLVWGSTTSISGAVSFTLPYTNASAGQAHPIGLASLVDNGTGTTEGTFEYNTTTTARIRAKLASGTYVAPTALSSTVPFTWTTSDEISVSGKYIY